MEQDGDSMLIYGKPNDLFKIKDAISSVKSDIEFTVDEISMLPKDRIKLEGEDLDTFNRLLTLLDDVDDVQNVYHNVEL